MRAAHVAGHFLQANEVGIFRLDDVDDPLQAIQPIAPADAFMNVVTQKTHSCPNPHNELHQSTATFTTAFSTLPLPASGAWASLGKNTAKWPGGSVNHNSGLSLKNTMSFSLSYFSATLVQSAAARQPNSSAVAPAGAQ